MWTFLVNSAFGIFVCDDINYIAKFIDEHDINMSFDDVVEQIKGLDEECLFNIEQKFYTRFGILTVTKIEKRGR